MERARVLYVDDVPVNLKLFKEVFKNDYDISITEYPEEVPKILEEENIQVLVSDQRMPVMSGIELLEIVAEKFPDVRRFLLTAFTDTETVIEAINVGRIHGYIAKPFNADEVRATINASLEVYHLRVKNKEILQELEKANAELVNLDGLKSEIIESISREISLPLNDIMGTLHLLKSKIEGEELMKVVNVLDQSVIKLEQFSLLAKQMTTLKSPGYSMQKEEVSFGQLIQYASIEVSDEFKSAGIKLSKEMDENGALTSGDSELLVTCLVNLLRFAREHCRPDEDVLVRVGRDEDRLVCEVRDQGNYSSDEVREALENHYGEKDSPLNLSLGIGLALSKMIMEAHGGALVFARLDNGSGSMKMIFGNE